MRAMENDRKGARLLAGAGGLGGKEVIVFSAFLILQFYTCIRVFLKS